LVEVDAVACGIWDWDRSVSTPWVVAWFGVLGVGGAILRLAVVDQGFEFGGFVV
jgi:hypothetical protein